MSETAKFEPTGKRRELIDILIGHGAQLKVDYRPKQRSKLSFIFDCGVFKGQHVYECRYDHIDAFYVASILISEGIQAEQINDAIFSVIRP